MKRDYIMKRFHEVVCDSLDKVANGEIKKLMLVMPPQHGKSEIATRNFPAYLLGKDPSKKVAIVSYSATVANRLNRAVQRAMFSNYFHNVFGSIHTVSKYKKEGQKKTQNEFTVEGGGYCISTGVGGSLTSMSVDIGIIDDPIKDRQEANSIRIRENVWEWYTDVFCTRLHDKSSQIIINTRWHQDDLSGRVLAQDGLFDPVTNPTGWVLIRFPAIKEADENPLDDRQEGEALFPEKHSIDRLLKIKNDNPVTFNALYQGDPKPNTELLIYPEWTTCKALPNCDVVFYGLDFGFTNDPTALVKVGKSGNALYFQQLIYERGLTTSALAKRIKDFGIKSEIYADSADPKAIEELRQLGLFVMPAVKGSGSIEAGISKLKEYSCFVTESSLDIIKEKNNYTWVAVGNSITNIPIDEYNHALDAIRYAVYTKYFKKEIKVW